MPKQTFSIFLLFTFINVLTIAQNPVKLRRADCFFGIHFDLHASEDITNAGETLTPEMVDTFLTKVRPDFIQIDCKGHPGISSYPTKVGNPVKGFQKDPATSVARCNRKEQRRFIHALFRCLGWKGCNRSPPTGP